MDNMVCQWPFFMVKSMVNNHIYHPFLDGISHLDLPTSVTTDLLWGVFSKKKLRLCAMVKLHGWFSHKNNEMVINPFFMDSYIHIWVNFITTSPSSRTLESWLVRGIIPKWHNYSAWWNIIIYPDIWDPISSTISISDISIFIHPLSSSLHGFPIRDDHEWHP